MILFRLMMASTALLLCSYAFAHDPDCDTYESCLELAKQQNGEAQYNLFIILSEGLGVKKDPENAVKWLISASNAGVPDAETDYGLLLLDGRQVEKDEKKAFSLFQKASKSNHVEASYNLGKCYLNGTGTDKNVAKAFEYLFQAAEQRDELAQLEIGKCFANGIGTTKDFIKAYAWYTVAYAGSGSEHYANLQKKIFNQLSDGDKKSAENLAQMYLAKYS